MKATELLKAANREEADLLDKMDLKQLPQHLAVIMDGNGRWAQRRHLPRIAGHRAGVKAAREIIETCARLKLPCLTLYAFSLENWRRPQAEVDFLMRLLREYLKRELPAIHKNNIRLLVIGRSEQLPDEVRKDIEDGMRLTANNTGMKLVVALNYGARAEIVDAFNAMLEQVRQNGMSAFRADEQNLRASLHRRPARSRPTDPHQRRNARQQFSALADRLRRNLRHRNALARFFPRASARSPARFPEARTPLRRPRHRPNGAGQRSPPPQHKINDR